MADKKKSASTVYPYFVDGEQPTANKFNSISLQVQANMYVLEKAIGDLWAESWPYNSSTPTHLSLPVSSRNQALNKYGGSIQGFGINTPSLSRLIGPSSKLNPSVLTEGLMDYQNSTFTDEATLKESIEKNKYAYCLGYKTNDVNSIVFSGTSVPTNQVSSPDLLSSSSDWWYDVESDSVYFHSASQNDWHVTYKTTPSSANGVSSYNGSSWNVIPDEASMDWAISQNIPGGVTVTALNEGYQVSLPTISRQNEVLTQPASVVLDESDHNFGAQLKLPNVLREMFNSSGPTGSNFFDHTSFGTSGSLIPEGFIYLKNYITGEIYDTAEYYYLDNETLEVKNVELDLSPGTIYCLVTVGTDITSSIQNLNTKYAVHNHSKDNGEQPVNVKDLVGSTDFAGLSGAFTHSVNVNNYFPQYLHRDGYRSGTDDGLNDRNMIRGDLLIGRAFEHDSLSNPITEASTYYGIGTTYSLKFGTDDSHSIKRTWGEDSIWGVQLGRYPELQLYDERFVGIKGDRGVTLQSENDIFIYSDDSITVNAQGDGYINYSNHNTDHNGCRLGDKNNKTESHTNNSNSKNYTWKNRQMKCVTLISSDDFYIARKDNGEPIGNGGGDAVYCHHRFPLPADVFDNEDGNLSTSNIHEIDRSRITSVNVMLKPASGRSTEFSNFPGSGNSLGMMGYRAANSQFTAITSRDFDSTSGWAGSSAGGEAYASGGWWNGAAADWLQWLTNLLGITSFTDKILGNGMWWRINDTSGPMSQDQNGNSVYDGHCFIDVFVGEGWMNNSDMESHTQNGNKGARMDTKITVWYWDKL